MIGTEEGPRGDAICCEEVPGEDAIDSDGRGQEVMPWMPKKYLEEYYIHRGRAWRRYMHTKRELVKL